LSDLQVRCNLRQADSDRFFSEWLEDLPDLDERERAGIERLKQRYDYHPFDGLANPQSDRPVFGIATNGDEFVFLKLSQGDARQYDASRTFSLFPRRHELGEVLRILKRFGQAVLE
jgi:hypothetical protein